MKLPSLFRTAETQPAKHVWEVILNPRPLLYYGKGKTKAEAVENAWEQFEQELENECSALNCNFEGFDIRDAEEIEAYPSGSGNERRYMIQILHYTRLLVNSIYYSAKYKLRAARQKTVKLATKELNANGNGNKVALGLFLYIETLLLVSLGGVL